MSAPIRLKRQLLQDKLPARLREAAWLIEHQAVIIDQLEGEVQNRDEKIAKLKAKIAGMENAKPQEEGEK